MSVQSSCVRLPETRYLVGYARLTFSTAKQGLFPASPFVVDDYRKITAGVFTLQRRTVHRPGRSASERLQNCRQQVNGRRRLRGCFRSGLSRVFDEKRHIYDVVLIAGLQLPKACLFPKARAMIGGDNNQRLMEKALLFDGVDRLRQQGIRKSCLEHMSLVRQTAVDL